MATDEFACDSLDELEHLEPPKWQYDQFVGRMHQWRDAIDDADDQKNQEVEMLKIFVKNPKAAFHFDLFSRCLAKWRGATPQIPHDGIQYLRNEELNVVIDMKHLMRAMETDFVGGKLLALTCEIEHNAIKFALLGSKDRSSDCLSNHLTALKFYLKDESDPRYWETWNPICRNIVNSLYDTGKGLQSLLDQHRSQESSPKALATQGEFIQAQNSRHELGGLRRRRPDAQQQHQRPEGDAHDFDRGSEGTLSSLQVGLGKIATPVAWFTSLAGPLKVACQRIRFTEISDAFWKDHRAPIALSLISTSLSSIFIGVALMIHVPERSHKIDDGFYMLLSQTIIQLFSLYVILLPFLRNQQPHLVGLWFCSSIGASTVFSVVSCIVYAFSWRASAILGSAGTLAAMVAALLLVQGIDKSNTEKHSEVTKHDV